jgi:F-type H+-transporting ATPase subunit b
MLIDWFTVAAQALNFLVLVWLLKRFLYRPILDAVGAREKAIAGQLNDAAAKEAAALTERAALKLETEAFDTQRVALFNEAKTAAQAERQRLLEDARKEADSLRARLQETLRSEQEALSGEITRKVEEEAFALARKILTSLATVSLEESMTRVFIDRLRALPGPAKGMLESALQRASGAAIVRSASELTADQRASIVSAIDAVSGVATHLQFETAPGLLSGLELTAGGQKLAWSIADCLGTLESSIGAILTSRAGPGEHTAPALAKVA